MSYKVLFISNISHAPFTSVADRMLIRGLHNKGIDITVVTPLEVEVTRELEDEGITMEYLPLDKKISRSAIRRLRDILVNGRFDILHITYSKAATNGLLAARGLPLKIVAYYGSLSLHWHDPMAYLAFLNHNIDVLICNSEAVADHVRKQLLPRFRKKVVRVYRGYDPAWLDNLRAVTRESLSVTPGEFLICSVGNLRKVKGIRYLIRAVALLPAEMRIKVLLVGSGTDSPETRKLTEATGRPECFILQGPVDLPPAYVAPCDLYIQPSLSEGLGRAISEAMCLAKPVIVTDGGGAKEYFDEGDNGFVVKRASAEALADAIKTCYKNKASLARTGMKAKEAIMNHFNHRHTIDKTYDVYCNLMADKY